MHKNISDAACAGGQKPNGHSNIVRDDNSQK